MKTGKLINIFLSGVLITLSLSNCTDDFEKINTNQLVLAEVDQSSIGNVFASAEYNGLFYNGWQWQIAENLFADLYVQYYSNIATGFPTDRHFMMLNWLDGAWDFFY